MMTCEYFTRLTDLVDILKPIHAYSIAFNYSKHFSYTSLYGYFSESFIITYLAVFIILPAIKTYFKRNVFICRLYSEILKKSNLKSKNRLYESIII